MKRILAQIRKELVQLRRDPISVALALALPVILMLLFGTALSLTVSGLPVAIQDLDRSPASRSYAEMFGAALIFRVHALEPQVSPETALRNGKARGVVIIPPDFGRDLARGRSAEVQVLIDATDANTANVLRGNVAGITRAFAANQSPPPDAARTINGRAAPVIAATRLWYNPGREDRKTFVPGALVVCLALLPPLLASLATAREVERGTILQVYVSGVRAHEYLLGKIGAFFLVAFTVWLLLTAIAFFVFGLRLVGNPVPFLVSSVLFLFSVIAFGVLIGVRVPDQASAIQATQLFSFVLSFLLSGFLFPVENIPAWLRWVSAIVPARYFIEVVRDAFLRGGGWSAVGDSIAALALFGVLFFVGAWRQMRRMQVSA
ncbi:MAG: ABC transporter permease [Armatimonadaceae bacterium]